ncbi:MAG: TrkH family potassium uptake protein, partial [Spirochaetaceae bacterium]|nr:TrkH family potassium uptake protein [Spirochaetaceae bacterium]
MKFFSFVRLIFILLSIIAITMLIPLVVAFVYGETSVYSAFLIPISSCLFLGILFYFIGKNQRAKLSVRSGFAIVAIFW